ncbi:hypothetical protein EVB55_241 [Rhizobium phage RHph_Y68]|uniref:Uncharacterized protein n=1 Tax=Rhizobium phage RHph_Y68 TaxID=2509787 RepID=A0A7S5R3N2_9CAUD|nr:hypothetical protein PP934_gp241 [Rhizobium phage RHph_Y68]QIG68176.1 hypothetical protein EVB55_241 [Rhizobium phage RHph_Y68]
MSDQNEQLDRFQMMKMCISCRHYNSGHNECRRFPPVPVTYIEKRYDSYNHLIEYPTVIWSFPTVEANNPKCGEHVLEPRFG